MAPVVVLGEFKNLFASTSKSWSRLLPHTQSMFLPQLPAREYSFDDLVVECTSKIPEWQTRGPHGNITRFATLRPVASASNVKRVRRVHCFMHEKGKTRQSVAPASHWPAMARPTRIHTHHDA
jgi:hypothetical protein